MSVDKERLLGDLIREYGQKVIAVHKGEPLVHGEQPAAGPWQTGEPPKDGTEILGQWGRNYFTATWYPEQDAGRPDIYGRPTPKGYWMTYGKEYWETEEPDRYAIINK